MVRASWCLTLAALLATAGMTRAADWPQWRGPAGNGTASGTGLNRNWAAKPPQVLWQVPMGDQGCAGPSVADGKVFIIDHAGDQDLPHQGSGSEDR